MAVYFLPKSRAKKFLARTDLPPDVVTIDISSKATEEWSVLSPAFNHGEIPVPGMPGKVSCTVAGIWEGLKRFENEGEELAFLEAEKPKKRRVTKDTGKVVGYLYGTELLKEEVEARRLIFIPAYTWMIKNAPAAREKFEELVAMSRTHTVHLYDGEESNDVHSPKPYSYAALLADMVKEARKAALV